MKKNVVLYKKIPETELARLQHFNVTCFDGVDEANTLNFSRTETGRRAYWCEQANERRSVTTCAHLKACSTISVGLDQFDVDYLNSRTLMHTPSVLTKQKRDTIFTANAARRAVELSNMVRDGKWLRSIGSEHYGVNVYGKTIGIVGMGRIGYGGKTCPLWLRHARELLQSLCA